MIGGMFKKMGQDLSEFFATLGVDPTTQPTPEKIKKAWKQKCKQVHPDHGGTQEEFLRVTHAYKMLTDISYRQQQNQKQPDRGDLDLRIQIPIDFMSGFFGKKIILSYNRTTIGANMQPVPFKEGQVEEIVNLTMEIEPGTCSPCDKKMKGYGHRNESTNEFGDAIIIFIPQQHQRFRVEGPDVFAQEPIPLNTMLCGGEIEVQTLYGLRTANVEPASKPGTEIRIPKCGVNKSGDHVAVLEPVFPNQEDLKKKEWKKLDINWKKTEEQKEDEKLEEDFVRYGFQNGSFIFVKRGADK